MAKSNIFRDGFTLLGGNAWAQGIAFVAYLALGRLYAPADFAQFNVFYSYIEVFIILSTCKYELSIIVAETDREAMASARLALRLNAVVSLLLISLVWLLPLPKGVALMIPFMVFFCGTSRVYAQLFNRFRRFGEIAVSEIVTSTSGVLAKIVLAFSSLLHGMGLPLGTVLGKAVGNVNLLLRLHRLPLPSGTTRQERIQVARKFRNFPLFNMPKEFLSSFSHNLPFLWLALYFRDNPAVGLFALATLFFRPVNILNGLFEKLLYVRIAERVRSGEPIAGPLRRFLLWLNAAAIPLFLILFLWAEPLCVFLFGSQWQGIGYYVRCLVPWLVVSLSSTSLSFLANVFGRQRQEFRFYLLLLLLRAGAMLYGILTRNYSVAILLFSLSGAFVGLMLLVWYLLLVRGYQPRAEEEKVK